VEEERTRFSGTIEIWVDGEKYDDVKVDLAGYVQVAQVETHGGITGGDNRTWWGGVLHGLSQAELSSLLGKRLELRLPSRQVGEAVLADTNGTLSGIGQTPDFGPPPRPGEDTHGGS
jgi:hypothetical protein